MDGVTDDGSSFMESTFEAKNKVVTINKYEKNIRTIERKTEEQSSPTIVITCPAEAISYDVFCRNCQNGSSCCIDPNTDDYSDCYSSYAEVKCSDCGSSIASNSSDYSTCFSEDESQNVSEFNSEKLIKYTSMQGLNENLSSAESENETNSTLTNDSSDEDVMFVGVDDETLKDVINSRLSSEYSNSGTSDNDYDYPEDDGENKDNEILLRFLDQVEMCPQDEDLDVILEIVGEEDDEPTTRSLLNIRECSDKFKEIYAKKLRQIYNNKNREQRMKKYQELVSQIREKTVSPNKENQDTFIQKSKDLNKEFSETSSTCSSNSRRSSQDGSIIERLPEIRKFHPSNLDPKMSEENRTYLRATSLINEIETCFMETAYLVEKNVGGEKPSLNVLRTNYEDSDGYLDEKISSNKLYNETSPSKLHNETSVAFSDDDTCSSIAKERNNYLIDSATFISGRKSSHLDEVEDAEEIVHHEKSILDCEANHKELSVESEEILPPRSLEESIELFEIMVGGKENDIEESKPNSTLTSSTLVLNSDRIFKQQNDDWDRIMNKCKSTTDLLNSTIDDSDSSYLNYCKPKLNDSIGSGSRRYFKTFDADNEKLSYFNSSNETNSAKIPNINYYKTKPKAMRNEIQSDNPNSYYKYESIDTPNTHSLKRQKSNWSNEVNLPNDDAALSKIRTQVKEFLRTSTTYTKNEINRSSSTDYFDIPSPKRNNKFKWKSEPDFGLLSNRNLALQSNLNEEYFHDDFLTSSVTSTVYKNIPEPGQNSDNSNEFNNFSSAKLNSKPRNYGAEDSNIVESTDLNKEVVNGLSKSDTIGILNEQPLFAHIDDLLRGVEESKVDTSTDTDEGVVSDQSGTSDFVYNENADVELEQDIDQIVKGINAIKEKHLGQQIEREIEETLKEIHKESFSHVNSDEFLIRHQKKLEERYKQLLKKKNSELFDDFIGKLNFEIDNLTKLGELDPLSEIAKISEDLKSMNVDEQQCDDINVLNPIYHDEEYIERISRLEMYQRIKLNKLQEEPKSPRSNSCYSYFKDQNTSTEDLSCVQPKPPTKLEPSPKSFILRTLHNNLRYYVITLAILEKLLNDNSDLGDICNSMVAGSVPEEGIPADAYGSPHLNSGNMAFLEGLKRQHHVQMPS